MSKEIEQPRRDEQQTKKENRVSTLWQRVTSVFKSKRSPEGDTPVVEEKVEQEPSVFQILNEVGLKFNKSERRDKLGSYDAIFKQLYRFTQEGYKAQVQLTDAEKEGLDNSQQKRLQEEKRLAQARRFAELHVFYDLLSHYHLTDIETIDRMDDSQKEELYRTLGRFLNILELFSKETFSDSESVDQLFTSIEEYLLPLIEQNKKDVSRWLEELDALAEQEPNKVFLSATIRGRKPLFDTVEDSFLTEREEKFGVAADEYRGLVMAGEGKFVLKKVRHQDSDEEILGLPYLPAEDMSADSADFSVYPQAKYMRQESHIALLPKEDMEHSEEDVYDWEQITAMIMDGRLIDTETIAALYIQKLTEEHVTEFIDPDPDDFAFGTVIEKSVKGDKWLNVSADQSYVTTPYDESLGVFYDPQSKKFLLNYEFFPQRGNFAGLVLNGGAVGDDGVFSPKGTVQKELAQEHGLKAEKSDQIGKIKGASRYGGEGGGSFLHFVELSGEKATKSEAEGGDERYEVGQKWLSLDEIKGLIMGKRIRCARTIAAFFISELHMQNDKAI